MRTNALTRSPATDKEAARRNYIAGMLTGPARCHLNTHDSWARVSCQVYFVFLLLPCPFSATTPSIILQLSRSTKLSEENQICTCSGCLRTCNESTGLVHPFHRSANARDVVSVLACPARARANAAATTAFLRPHEHPFHVLQQSWPRRVYWHAQNQTQGDVVLNMQVAMEGSGGEHQKWYQVR